MANAMALGGSGTFLTGYHNRVFEGGNGVSQFGPEFASSGTAVRPGFIVKTTNSGKDIELADSHATTLASVDKPYGIAFERDDLDVDLAFATNKTVQVAPIGSGQIVWIPLVTSSGAVAPGDTIYVSDTAGHGRLFTFTSTATPTTTTNDLAAAQLAIMEKSRVGTAQALSADVAAVRWIPVLLD